jgi:hypothetical protein
MAEDLRKDDLIAIFYPLNPLAIVQNAWVAWSRGSPNFAFPPKSTKDLPSDVEIPLLVAAHTMLPPIDMLSPQVSQSLELNTQVNSPNTSLLNRVGLPGLGNARGYERPPRRSNVHNNTMMSGSFQPQIPWTPAPAQESLLTTENDHYPSAEFLSNQPAMKTDPKIIFESLNKIMNVEKLAIIENSGKVSEAHLFFLHFPLDDKEAQEELIILRGHLEFHGKAVFTNLDPEGWSKFEQNSKMGVVIVCVCSPFNGSSS